MLLLKAHADTGKNILPVKPLDNSGNDLVNDGQKPCHLHLLALGVGKSIIEQSTQVLLEPPENSHVQRLQQPRALRRHEQGQKALGMHCLEDLITKVGIGHVE